MRNTSFENLIKYPFEDLKGKEILDDHTKLFTKDIIKPNNLFEEEYLNQYDTVKGLLEQVNTTSRATITQAATKYILLALKYMKKKLPYKGEVWDDIEVVFFSEFNKKKWINLMERFSNIISTDTLKESFIHELSRLEYNFPKIQYNMMLLKPTPLRLWNGLKHDYPTIFVLVKALLVLPNSSVCVERMFSTLKNIKNPKRNRLTVQNLEACLLSYQYFRTTNINIGVDMLVDFVELDQTNSFKHHGIIIKLL